MIKRDHKSHKIHKIRFKNVQELVDSTQWPSTVCASKAWAVIISSWLHHMHISIQELTLKVILKCRDRVFKFEFVINIIHWFCD